MTGYGWQLRMAWANAQHGCGIGQEIGRVNRNVSDKQERRLDLAARAAWLYYIANNTQDEIATKLKVSRQGAQRLVSLATEEGLIKFRLDHPIAECAELTERLRDRFSLEYCQVVPSDPAAGDSADGLAAAVAEQLERYFNQKEPIIMAFGTGRSLREAVQQVSAMSRPQHKVVSLVGNMSRDGQASPYDVVMHLAERVGARCFPMPTPVIAESVEDCDLLKSQRAYLSVTALVAEATVAFVGVGVIGPDCPLHKDGFITDAELDELMARGAVGEIVGSAYDRAGKPLDCSTNARLTAIPLDAAPGRLTIAVAGGASKASAIGAALRGGLISGLLTDESAAHAILDGA